MAISFSFAAPQKITGRKLAHSGRKLRSDRRGTALIEFSIVFPVMMIAILGIIVYGEWFYIAHNVQQAVNDGARSAISGLNSTERLSLVQTNISTGLAKSNNLDNTKTNITVDDNGTTLVVHLSYNASSDPLLHFGLIPIPGLTITRSAAVQLQAL